MNKKIFYKKEKGLIYNLLLFLKLNFLYNSSIIFACIIIGSFSNNIFRAILTSIILYFWAYFVHVFAHKIPGYVNPHKIHHNPKISHKWWAVLTEFLINIIGSGGLLLMILNIIIENTFKIKLLDNYVLVYTMILYSTFHMINYHYLKVSTHLNHHKYENANYGPDIIDMIFDTKINNDEIENMNHGIYNSIIALVIVLLNYKSRYDIVEIIREVINKII